MIGVGRGSVTQLRSDLSIRWRARAAFRLAQSLAALGVAASIFICSPAEANGVKLPANFNHFDHLVVPARVRGVPVDVVAIYSNYPAYSPAVAPGEGYACVDDAARAMVLLSDTLEQHSDSAQLRQLELLSRFVLQMQNENGYFNNFIRSDGSINTTGRTSVAALNWWSLRALWGLEAAYRVVPHDTVLARQIAASTSKVVANIERDMPSASHKYRHMQGLRIPTWLPAGSGADQASVAIIGLLLHYRRTQDARLPTLIGDLADGIIDMQVGDADHFPYEVHLSWRNSWHAWGNYQAYALLLAGQQFNRRAYTASALSEVRHFYPYLISRGYLSGFSLQRINGKIRFTHVSKFPQIAYGIQPMVYAAVQAFRVTGNERYREIAQQAEMWFLGANPAHRPVYNEASGVVYDGIGKGAKINPNSGAESTIAGLMAIQRLSDVQQP